MEHEAPSGVRISDFAGHRWAEWADSYAELAESSCGGSIGLQDMVGLATVFDLGGPCDDGLMRPTVLIVDDHASFRTSARALLEADGFVVIGESGGGDHALRAVEALRPHVVLLDIQLPGIDGFALAEQLAERSDPPAVVLISSRDATAYGPRLRDTPSRGFIPKSELSGKALAALID